MGVYDLELQNLARRRALAQALQGAQAPGVYNGGRVLAVPKTGDYLATLAQQVLGGVVNRRADKEEKALDARRANDTVKFLQDLQNAQTPDTLEQPVVPGATAMPSGNPAEDAARVARMTSGMQTAVNAQDAGQQAQRQRILAAALQGTELGGVPAMIGANVLSNQFAAQKPDEYTLGQGEVRFKNGREVARGAPKENPEDKLLVNVVDTTNPLGYKTIKRSDWKGETLYEKPPSQTNVNLPPEETAEDKAVGEAMGKLYASAQDNAAAARTQNAKLDRIAQLSEGLDTGKYSGTFADIANAAKSFGITLDEKLGAKQGIVALANEIALSFRNPAGGEGMPGALSDKDRDFLVGMSPGLAQTAEGRRVIIETRRKLNERKIQEAKLLVQYRKEHKHIDEGAMQMLQDYADAHPIFPQAAPTQRPPLSSFGGGPQ